MTVNCYSPLDVFILPILFHTSSAYPCSRFLIFQWLYLLIVDRVRDAYLLCFLFIAVHAALFAMRCCAKRKSVKMESVIFAHLFAFSTRSGQEAVGHRLGARWAGRPGGSAGLTVSREGAGRGAGAGGWPQILTQSIVCSAGARLWAPPISEAPAAAAPLLPSLSNLFLGAECSPRSLPTF